MQVCLNELFMKNPITRAETMLGDVGDDQERAPLKSSCTALVP